MSRLTISTKRKLTQLLATIVLNGNFKGFAAGTIYSGKLKQICVPGLNCYSCPGAFGACPLGALQTMLADPFYKMSFYVIGFLTAVGTIAGRWVCGWLCPFGFLQELLHMPTKLLKKRGNTAAVSRKLKTPFVFRYIKYVFLLLLVILLPIFLVDEFGFGAPYFCELVCPAGTIMGALPLFIATPSLTAFIGTLFYIKVSAAALFVAGSVVSKRFFCKYICPLGAIYGLFNRFALTRLVFHSSNCNGCQQCIGVCCMDIDPRKPDHRIECICCGKCVKACDQNALCMSGPKSLYQARKA